MTNAWSSYLALIKAGAQKTLIPAYKDMDPYDLPEEFSHLQAQDKGRLGLYARFDRYVVYFTYILRMRGSEWVKLVFFLAQVPNKA